MLRNPALKRRTLEVLGIIALVLILLTALLGAMFTEGLMVTISSAPALQYAFGATALAVGLARLA